MKDIRGTWIHALMLRVARWRVRIAVDEVNGARHAFSLASCGCWECLFEVAGLAWLWRRMGRP
jgi:hypothetical protein